MKHKKKLGIALITALLASIPFAFAQGSTLFSDTFNTLTNVDTTKTTVLVDTGNGWVELWHPSTSTAIAADGASGSNVPQKIIVADSAGAQWYSYDQATGKMINNTPLGQNYSNPVGVSLVRGTNTYYTLLDEGGGVFDIRQAVFDGSSEVDNPLMLVSGLNDVATFTAISDKAVANADRKGNVTVYANTGSGVQKDLVHSFPTGLNNIVAIANIPGTWNFKIFTTNAAYEYDYDQASGGYIQNPQFTQNAGTNTVVSGDVTDNGDLVDLLSPMQDSAYAFDQAQGDMKSASIYTIGSLSGAVAVSVPNDQSTVIATQDGKAHTYQLIGSNMVDNPNLLIQGVTFVKDYQSPGVYQSTPITPPSQNNMFQLAPTENNDTGTSITYALSVDGGSTFTAVQPDVWEHLPANTTNPPSGANVPSGPYIVQATLNSSSSNSTPRITDIALNGYLDVTPPTVPGQPTASPNPSGQTTTTITWPASTDVLQAPSTGVSGVTDYLIQFSTDNGVTWGSWIDTNSATPDYVFTVPPNTAQNFTVRVEAKDVAGNISAPSPIGQVFIDTYPLSAGSVTVVDVIAPSDPSETFPTTSLPVQVKAGGEVLWQIDTKGGAQQVQVTYSDGTTQDLIPQYPTSTSDTNTWTGYYYPSSTQTIPLTTPDGTYISISNLTVSGLGKPPVVTSSSLLVVNGNLGAGADFIPPQVNQ